MEEKKKDTFEKFKPLYTWKNTNPLKQVWLEARKTWLEELGYTEEDIFIENGIEHTFVDGYKIKVPLELTSLEEFSARLKSNY